MARDVDVPAITLDDNLEPPTKVANVWSTSFEREFAAAARNPLVQVLITTNVLARGVDVPAVTLVVNYDLPIMHRSREPDYESYLHRIGRTGRFGRRGVAINFVPVRLAFLYLVLQSMLDVHVLVYHQWSERGQ